MVLTSPGPHRHIEAGEADRHGARSMDSSYRLDRLSLALESIAFHAAFSIGTEPHVFSALAEICVEILLGSNPVCVIQLVCACLQ